MNSKRKFSLGTECMAQQQGKSENSIVLSKPISIEVRNFRRQFSEQNFGKLIENCHS